MKQHYHTCMSNILRRAVIGGIFAGLMIISACSSTSALQDNDIVPFDTGFVSGTLDNGLQYFIRHNETPKNRATIQLAVRAGSINEEENQRGLAHLVEHMAFNGTKHFPKNSLIDFAQRIGMSFGAHINAYTSFDETVYNFEIPTDDPKIVDKGLQVLQDWLQYLSLDPQEIDDERGVVLNEWRAGLGVYDKFIRTVYPVWLQGSRYAKRITIGLPDIIKNAPRERLLSFYNKWYRPNNAVFIITGDVDTEEIKHKLIALFNTNTGGDTTIPQKAMTQKAMVPPSYPVPIISRDVPAVVLFDDKEAPIAGIEVSYKAVLDPYAHTVEALKKAIISNIIANAMQNRFADVADKKDAPIDSMSITLGTIGNADILHFFSKVKQGNIGHAYPLLLQEIEKLHRYGILDSELQLARKGIVGRIRNQYTEKEKLFNTYWGSVGLSQFLKKYFKINTVDIDWLHDHINALLSSISLEDINTVLSKYLDSRDVMIAFIGPDKTEFPSKDEILRTYANKAQLAIAAPSKVAVRDTLMTTVPKMGRIVKETKLSAFDIYQLDLENGARVLYKRTDFQKDTISFMLHRKGGKSQLDAQSYKQVSMLFSVFDDSGFSSITPEELRRFLGTKIGFINLGVSDYSIYGYGSANNDSFETMLQLLYLDITEPYISDTVLANAKASAKSDLQQRQNVPQQVFFDKFTNTYNNNDARTQVPTAKDVDALTAQKLYDLRAQLIDGVKDFTFVFVGNISPNAFKTLVRRYIASLPAGKGENPPTGNDIIPTFEISRAETVKKGKDAKSTTLLEWVQDISPGAFVVQESVVRKVLSSLLNIRVLETLREKEGKTYSPFAYISFQVYPTGQVSTEISFSADPADVEYLAGEVQSLIDEIRTGNISEEVISKAKKELIKNREVAMKNNTWWAETIDFSVLSGLDIQAYVGDAYTEMVNSVTRQMLTDFAQKYIKDDRKLEMSLLPESK